MKREEVGERVTFVEERRGEEKCVLGVGGRGRGRE